MKLYNGSAFKIENPKILTSGFYKDFGYGFYCTNVEKQARRWAAARGKQHIVNVYSYAEDKNLNILKFDNMAEEWLDFVVNCRRGKMHTYDIVEGPMADDTIWNFVNDYLANNISKAVFWEYAKFKHPTHQISFHSIRALGCLQYERSEIVNDEEME